MTPIALESRIVTVRTGTGFTEVRINTQMYSLEPYQLLQEINRKSNGHSRSVFLTHIKSMWRLTERGIGREALLHAVTRGARPLRLVGLPAAGASAPSPLSQ